MLKDIGKTQEVAEEQASRATGDVCYSPDSYRPPLDEQPPADQVLSHHNLLVRIDLCARGQLKTLPNRPENRKTL